MDLACLLSRAGLEVWRQLALIKNGWQLSVTRDGLRSFWCLGTGGFHDCGIVVVNSY